ncbi:MAG: hypothetical protein K5843_01465 [Bacteroidales bacterium]|nr:hypothetical protein [Bacteroidales bacterium]
MLDLLKKLTPILACFAVISCTVTVHDGLDLTEAQRHASNILLIGENMVDVITDVFYVDRCVTDYSKQEMDEQSVRIYFPGTQIEWNDNTIFVDRQRGIMLSIDTQGASLDAANTSWHVSVTRVKPWGDYVPEKFEFTVHNQDDAFALEGEMLANGLYRKSFFYSTVNLSFTTFTTTVRFSDSSQPDVYYARAVPVFVFDGSISSFHGENRVIGENELRYEIRPSAWKGNDPKEYFGSDPFYEGKAYFRYGTVNCVVSEKDKGSKTLKIKVNSQQDWTLEYDGHTESYRPYTAPIRL